MGKQARSAVMALLGAVALLVTGCTGDAAPNTSKVASSAPATSTAPTPTSPTPTSPTPASPTPASPAPTAQPYPADVPLTGHNVKPGEKPPLYPAAAKARTQAGANAFAEFYMRTLDWAYATTNPSYLKHYSAASCGLCTGLATGITRTATQRHRYLGGRLTIHPATTTAIGPATAPADYCSIVTVDITAQSIVDRTGEVVDVEPAHPNLRWKVCAQSFTTLWRATYLAGAK